MFGNEICEFNENKPEVKQPVDEKLEEVKKPLDELSDLFNDREGKLKDKLQECGALQDQIDDFVRRVKNLDERVEDQQKKPRSMKPGQMNVVMGDLENIKKDVADEKPVYENILADGKKLLDSIESPEEKDILQAKLDDLKKLWTETTDKVDDENKAEESILEKTKCLDDKMDDLEKFLDDQEKKLRALEPVGCSPEKLDQQQKQINALQNDTKSKKPSLEDIEKLIKELEPLCKDDQPEVLERLENLKKHFDEVEKLGDDRQAEISDIQDNVAKFNTLARPTNEKISKVEKALPELTLYGADKPKSVQVCEDLQKLKKQVDDLDTKVNDLEAIAQDLQEKHPTTDSKHLRDEADDLKDRLDKLKTQVSEKTDEVDGIIHDWDELENDVKKAVETVKKVNKDMDDNKPKKFAVDELACQVENIKAVESEIDSNKPLFDDIQKRGRKLREKGIGAETFGDELSTVDNRLRAVQRDIPKRLDELEKLRDALNDFNDKLHVAENDMEKMEKDVTEQKPVGGDKETIDEQMLDLKELTSELEKLQDKVSNLNDIRSDLNSKHPEADTSPIDGPLDKLNDRLADVNQKVSERKSKLDDALVQCGQFEDGVKSLLDWLKETEDLVDNQKPISAADQNVLRAQIQEQKLLSRMFADREPSITNLQKTGEELLSTTEDEEKKKEIEEDLEKVKALWDSLKHRVDDRKENLDDTLKAAEKFNKAHDDVLQKIQDLSKKVNSDENIPSATKDKIDEQITNVKALTDQAKELEPLVQAVLESQQQLEPFCTPEDAELIHDKVEQITEKSDKLNEDCQEKENDLDHAHDLLEEFLNKEKDLNDWMDAVQKELAEKQPNGAEAEKIKRIQKDVIAHKPDVEKLKEIGKELKKLVKPDEYPELKKVVEAVEEKYKNLKANVDETARDKFMAAEKVQAFDSKLDELTKWTNDKLNQQRVMEPVAVEADKIKEQMNDYKPFTADIHSKEPQFKDVYEIGETILLACNEEEEPAIKDKINNLKFNKQKLDKAADQRNENLVEALILAQQFSDVHNDVVYRLTNTENLLNQVDDDKVRGVELQKEKLQNIEDNIKQLQPLMATLKKTGADLIGISGPGQGSDSVQKKIDDCSERWDALKIASEDKGITVGAAAEQVEAVWAGIEDLIEKAQKLKETFKNSKPVPVQEEPITEEFKALEEQENIFKDLLEPVETANKNIDNILQEDPKSPTSAALKDKQRKLNNVMKFINTARSERRGVLENSEDAAKKFWPGLEKLQDTLLDVQAKMDEQAEPGIEPEPITELLKEHEELHSELNSNEDVIATLAQVTPVLVAHAAQEDKIAVHKELSNITERWDTIESAWKKRHGDLEHVKLLAEEFAKEKELVESWLSDAEEKRKSFEPIPGDIEDLRDQMKKLRIFHRDISKRQNEITKLSQKGETLAEKVNDDDSQLVHDITKDIEKRWADLFDNFYDNQQHLEEVLLERGHFSVAIEELLIWVEQTKSALTTEEIVPKDKKLIEVELSKLKVISNDVESHKPSVQNCQNAAQKLIDENTATNKPDLEAKLSQLNIGWDEIQELLKERDQTLQNAFDESRRFQGQVRELNIWLSEAKTFLKSKTPYGGKAEVLSKQLEKHNEFVRVIETREEIYIYIIETFEVLIQSSDISGVRILESAQQEIKTSWFEVNKLSRDISDKLENAAHNAKQLEGLISETEVWIIRLEGSISLFPKVSTVYETITVQIQEFEEVYMEVSERREVFRTIRSTADKVFENCTPEESKEINTEIDDLVVKWKKVNGKLKERKKVLDDNYEQSLIFFEGHEQLMTFLDDVEAKINSDPSVGKDAPAVKAQMRKHKEYQNELGKKQSKFNATIKAGTSLVDKSEPEEGEIIEAKVNDLTARWNAVCQVSVDRQHQLEEALLFHGMFQDAVQALLDWVDSVEPSLIKETAVMGDMDTVKLLIDNHKAFQRDLARREKNYESIVKTGEAMLAEGKVENADELRAQLDNLKDRWIVVGQMSITKQERLQNAMTLAKEFQNGCKVCITTLHDLENRLKEQGPIAEDAPGIRKQQEEYVEFMEIIEEVEIRVTTILKKGEVILRFCHPSALHTTRHRIAILKKRWTDVNGWARQRQARLDEALEDLIREEELTRVLLEWITVQETILDTRESTPLPDDYEVLSMLLDEHKLTQDEAEQKQPDYNTITKKAIRKPLSDQQRRSRGRNTDPNTSREFANPMVTHLSKRWQQFWLVIMDRFRRISEKLDEIRIRKAAADFSWPDWRDRYNNWLHDSKARVLDMWRKNDTDRDNKLTKDQFIHAIQDTSFPTEKWEIELVFDMHRRRLLITYQDFMDALKGRKRKPDKPITEVEEIDDAITLEVSKCCCQHRFKMEMVGVGKYKFGETQKLRLVRILRSLVMVRVGGGWETLAEFLGKNDPCRAEGRTNYELREKFVMPEDSSQGMQAFKSNYKAKTPTRPAVSREGSLRPSVSREGSSSGIPIPISRQKSGEIHKCGGHSHSPHSHGSAHSHSPAGSRLTAPTMSRKKSDLDSGSRLTAPSMSRKKSDLGENKAIPSYKNKDYSSVRGSGYGVSSPKKKTSESPSATGRSPSQPKITRERSGDVYSRLSKTTTTRTTTGGTATKTTHHITRSSTGTISTTRTSSTKATTPRRSQSTTEKEVKIRTPTAGTEKEVKPRTPSTVKSPRTPSASSATSEEASTPKGSASKQRSSVFDRLSSQGTATKKGASPGSATKKSSTKK